MFLSINHYLEKLIAVNYVLSLKAFYSLLLVSLLFLLGTGQVQAVTAFDDEISIPGKRVIVMEPGDEGVLKNDKLNNGDTPTSTAVLIVAPTKGNIACPGGNSDEICANGAFNYTPILDETDLVAGQALFDGTDTFQYRVDTAEGSSTATVTLTACEDVGVNPGTTFTCWDRNAFISKVNALGLHPVVESFDGTAFAPLVTTPANGIVNKGVSWSTNFASQPDNKLAVSSAQAIGGLRSIYDQEHGYITEFDPNKCNGDSGPPDPVACFHNDGITGSGTAVSAVGGFINSTKVGANISIFIKRQSSDPSWIETNIAGIDDITLNNFFGLIDTAQFTDFKFQEIDGVLGDSFPLFFDELIIAWPDPVVNTAPYFNSTINPQQGSEGSLISFNLQAIDDEGDGITYTMSGNPVFAQLMENQDGTATFSWTPKFYQAGNYTLTFSSTDDQLVPLTSQNLTVNITVANTNRAPVLQAIGSKSVEAGNLLSFSLSASDADSDNLSFSISGDPTSATFTDNGDGTADFDWTPALNEGGNYLVTFTVTDDGLPATESDSETITVSVTVPDVVPPVLNLPTDFSVEATTTTGANVTYTVSALDAIDGVRPVSCSPASGTNFLMGPTLVSCSATDLSANTANGIFIVTIVDTTPPTITVPANITVAAVDATGTPASATAIQSFLDAATATDVADGVITPVNNNAPVQFPLGLTTVTFSVTDSAGNPGSAQATVNVTDQQAPVITLTGGAVTLNVGDVFSDPGHSVSDNVDSNLVATITGSVNTAVPAVYTLSYNVSDAAGNAAQTKTRTVTVQDVTAPVVTPPANITVAAVDASGTPASTAAIQTFLNDATALDAEDGPITPVNNDAPVQFPLGLTTVTFSVTDSAGNPGSAQATVDVTDQQAPIITLTGGAVTLNVGDVFSDPGHSVSDNVDSNLVATITGSVNTAVPDIYILSYNVSDAAGNAAQTKTRTVTVQDVTAPVVTAPADITVAAVDATGTPASATAIQSFLSAATATDAEDGAITPVNNDAPVQFPLGLTTVTFSVTDSAGNPGSAQATVDVTDQQAPIITLTGGAVTLNVGDVFSDPGHSVSDNVDSNLVATITGSVNTAVPDIYILSYNVSDAAGNAAQTKTRTVTVQDVTAPVVTAPADITVAAVDATGTAASDGAIQAFLNGASATDAVDGPITPVNNNAPVQFPLGLTTVTFSVTDSAGNAGSEQATVNVTDQQAPVITLTGGAVTLNVGDVFSDPGHSVSDNVDSNLVATITGSVNTAVPDTYILSYNVSDAAGNAAQTKTRTVTVQDVTAPVVTAPANITVAAVDATGTPASATAIQSFLNGASATDAVDGPITPVNNDAPVQFPLGLTTVTFSVTDSAGNPGSAQATVNVTDQQAPVITLNGASSMTLNVGDTFTDPGSSVTDNVDSGLNAVVSGTVDTTTVGIYTLSYDVSDAAGNAALTKTRSVSIQDSVSPVVTAPANIIVAATDASGTAASVASIQSFLDAATATDAVDGPITPVNNDAPVQFPLGLTTVTFSVTDSAGNPGSAQATVNVTDQQSPVITLTGGSVTLNVGELFTDPGHTVNDNVDTNLVATISGSVNSSIPGIYTLTYNASDAAGNIADSKTRSVTVQDVSAPVVSAPANITVAAVNASGTPATDAQIQSFLGAATATDAVDGPITPVNNDAPVQFPLGLTTVTFSVTDSAGNPGSAQATVNVTDQQAPIITLTGGAVILNVGDVFSDPGHSVSDNVDTNLVATVTGSVDTASPGVYTLNYDVSDAAGNAAQTKTRDVTVQDVVAPVVVVPADILVAATDANGTAATNTAIAAFLNGATASDDVDGLITTVSHDGPAQFPLGLTSVTFTASDNAGNTGSATATVNVTDQDAPVITLNGATSITLNVGDAFSDPGSIVTDNVDSNLTATVTGTVNTVSVGLYTLSYNVTDAAGNVAITQTRSISVQDSVSPVVTPPDNIIVAANDAAGIPFSVAEIQSFLNAATAFDAVDGPINPVSNNAPGQFPLGLTTVTFSVTDSAGNPGSAQATVNVTDQQAPEITLNGASSITLNVDDVFSDPGSIVTDNVDTNLVASVSGSVDTSMVGLYTLNYNAVDAAGNTALTKTRNISVQDSVAPVVTPPASIIVAATDASGTAATDSAIAAFLNGASATDAVDGVISPVNNNAPSQFPLGFTSVIFSVTDSAGNAGNAQATVNVTDQQAPEITLNGANSITLNLGDVFTDPGSDVSDNVDTNLIASVTGNVNTSVIGVYTLSYDVSDAAGNAAVTKTRSVSVQDGAAPVVTPPANITVAAVDANGTSATVAAIQSFLNDASANDSVDGPITPVNNDAPGQFPLGLTTVTFSVTDSAGNPGSAQATVNVTDQEAPVITLTDGAITLNVGESFIEPGYSVTDNVDNNLMVAVSGNLNTALSGTYTLIYNVCDAAGNAAITRTRTVHVLPVIDTTPPVITLQGSSTLNIELGTPYIDAGATAFDQNDGVVNVVTSGTVNSNMVGSYTISYDASDAAGNAAITVVRTVNVTADATSPVITLQGVSPIDIEQGTVYVDDGAIASDNIDGDITSSIVINNPVNTDVIGSYSVTYNVTDAAGNPAFEVTRIVNVTAVVGVNLAPVVTAPADIVVPAKGGSTSVSLGQVQAIDDNDGEIPATPNQTGPFSPGRHQVVWSATDSAGLKGTALQIVDVQPLVEFLPDQYAETGETFTVRVELNGKAAVYPVNVNYEVLENGISVPAKAGVITINEGTEGDIDYTVPGNIVSGDISFNIISTSNAVIGPKSQHLLSVIAENIEPLASIKITQNNKPTNIIAADAGPVTVKVIVKDSNVRNTHRYDWSKTENVLLSSNPGLNDDQFIIDPASLSSGFYKVGIKVTDNGVPELDAEVERYIRVMSSHPVLSNTEDSDGDGENDEDEGIEDDDDDGIPNYQDGVDHKSMMQGRSGESNKWLMNVQSGLHIRLGTLSLLSGRHTANISPDEIATHSGSLGSVVAADPKDDYTNAGGYFDFEINNLSKPGQSALIVIPQHATIPANAVYRKYTQLNGWSDFVENNANRLYSVEGEEGVCPAPGDSDYQAGLIAGYHCVQLLIEDGGPNDSDGERNGVIVDPGGVGAKNNTPAPSSGGGGGMFPLVYLWILLCLYTITVFRKTNMHYSKKKFWW